MRRDRDYAAEAVRAELMRALPGHRVWLRVSDSGRSTEWVAESEPEDGFVRQYRAPSPDALLAGIRRSHAPAPSVPAPDPGERPDRS